MQMPYYVYVIRNKVTGRLYKGQTENLEKRLKAHSQSQTKTTSYFPKDWELFYHEIFSSRKEAVEREKYFKTAAGRRYLSGRIANIKSTDTRPNVPFGTGGE